MWTWRPAVGIEWVEPVGDRESPALLLATRDARLHLIDLKTGRSRLARPIDARAGVAAATRDLSGTGRKPVVSSRLTSRPTSSQPAGAAATDDLVYCFDRFRAYAIELGPDAALRWQAGSWPQGIGEGPGSDTPPEQVFQGDPEQLRRIVAGHATARGVLLVRDDGRAALLDRADGHVCWGLRLPAAQNVRLHARGDTAALVWKSGPNLAAALVDLATGRRSPIPLPADATWPTWSALTEDGLLVAHADRIEIWKPDRPRTVWRADPADTILAATMVLDVRSAAGTGGEARRRLLFGCSDGQLRAVALGTGATVWAAGDQSREAAYWNSLRVHDDTVFAATASGLNVRSAATGELTARVQGAPADRLLDAWLSGQTVWLLWREQRDGKPHLRLESHDFVLTQDAPPLEAAPTARRPQALGPPGVFLRGLWAPGRLVVATRRELRAYALP